jgi:ankyrin repeat protein
MNIVGAIEANSLSQLRSLLQEGEDPNKLHKGASLLYFAVANSCDIDLVKELVSHGADVEKGDSRTKQTPLMIACSMGWPAYIECLLQHGADSNATDKYGSTALMNGVRCGPVVIETVIKGGANVNYVSPPGLTALDLAYNGRLYRSALALLKFGASAELSALSKSRSAQKAVEWLTKEAPVWEAVDVGDALLLDSLLMDGRRVDLKLADDSKMPILAHASQLGNLDVVKILLKHGADKTARSAGGRSAVDYATNNPDLIRLLQ